MIESLPFPAIDHALIQVPQLRAPIVLVHGLLGYDRICVGPWQVSEYFRGIKAHLTLGGNRILIPRLSPTGGIETRARQLQKFLRHHVPDEPVHVIAHSLGGLDARYFISRLEPAQRVLSLTTIGTPHLGSSYADFWLRRLQAVCRPLFDLLRIPYQAFLDLTTSACRDFNARTPNRSEVRYYSVAGRCSGPWLSLPWLHAQHVVAEAEGENDGVVSVRSATWGEALEVWDGDHLNLINVKNRGAARHGLWIDRKYYYGRVLQRLAAAGF